VNRAECEVTELAAEVRSVRSASETAPEALSRPKSGSLASQVKSQHCGRSGISAEGIGARTGMALAGRRGHCAIGECARKGATQRSTVMRRGNVEIEQTVDITELFQRGLSCLFSKVRDITE
jgi:hypothetical protein